YGKASCQPKADAGNEYIYSNIEGIMGGTIPMETVRSELEIRVGASKAELYMGFLEVALAGDEGMSEEEQITAAKKYFAVGIATDGNYTTDSSGQYCYCQMDGFTPTGGTKEIVTSAPWVFSHDGGSAGDCASSCAGGCAVYLQDDFVIYLALRAAVVGALDLVESGGICAANTINIKWDPANKGAVIENQCTYEGAIEVPADPVKPGYTFSGWKLLENTTTE
ncbi:MAG: InlB B-repeat-containing protein, partial [Alphaproteobacteria bacterium]|nr:InlB B-repeat-containing protein [Alphaproteobacteria bacterium]